jgi:hypothetical protein
VSDTWKILLGFAFCFAILATVTWLSKIIALGNVEEKSSFGLAVLLVGLVEIGKDYIKAFVGWLFNVKKET